MSRQDGGRRPRRSSRPRLCTSLLVRHQKRFGSACSSRPAPPTPAARSTRRSRRTRPASTWWPCRTTRTSGGSSTPGRCCRTWVPGRSACASCPTSPASRCARRRCSPRRRRRSTCSPAVGSSSGSGRARSGTRSRRWGRRAGVRASRSTRSRRRSTSCERGGAASGRSASRASTTGWTARSPARHPRIPIGLWIGAYQPRMLRLTGRLGDGWLPSLGYLDLEDAADRHRTIDEAAKRAGRDPSEVRRILNAGVDGAAGGGWADQLDGPGDPITASTRSSSASTTTTRSASSGGWGRRSLPRCASGWADRGSRPPRRPRAARAAARPPPTAAASGRRARRTRVRARSTARPS